MLCAVLLTSEPVTVHNVPDIADVANLIRLLERMGVSVQSHGHGDYTFQALTIDLDFLESPAFVAQCSELRGSIMLRASSAEEHRLLRSKTRGAQTIPL